MIVLSPATNEPAFGDPALVGEWAAVLPSMLAAPQVEPWCQYAARRDGALVGMGGFKGPPDADGWVEIAYITLIPAEGSGVAKQIAVALLTRAAAEGVTKVCAHTLREDNASTGVLRANGFDGPREVIDPEDGPVWRWERMA